MAPVVPLDVFCSGQAQESFIYKGRWLKGVAAPLVAKTPVRHLTQVRHQKLKQAGFGITISLTPLL
jgi:hypothetical protein